MISLWECNFWMGGLAYDSKVINSNKANDIKDLKEIRKAV